MIDNYFLNITFQVDFTLDPNCVVDNKCMKKSLSSTYSNVRSMYYKNYLRFSEEEVRANVPPDLTQDKDGLCDLYETGKWTVNLVNTKMLIIFNTTIYILIYSLL